MLEEKIRNFSLLELVQRSKRSVRLVNSIAWAQKGGWMPFQTVGEYLDAGSSALKEMMQVERIGCKGAVCLDALIKDFVQDQESCFNIVPARDEIREAQGAGPLAHENFSPGIDYESPAAKKVTLEDFLSASLENLAERERHVITDRYGMNGAPRKTLEAVGQQLNVTRERIRQIERRAIRKLRDKSGGVMKSYVKNKQQEIYEKLADGKHVVPFEQLSKQEAALSGEYRLALDIAYGSTKRWLEDVAKSISSGWYMFPFMPEDISAWQEKIDEHCKETSLPRPIVSMIEPLRLTRNQIEVALEFMKDYKIFSGYLLKGNITPRKRRCIWLHQLMNHAFQKKPAMIDQMLRKYHAYYPSDLCSARDLDITLRDSPHLFVNLNESGWIPIGATETTLISKEAGGVETENYFLPGANAGSGSEKKETLFQILHKMMEDEGPLTFLTAKNRFTEIAGSKYSPNSVFPTLITNSAFVRMAPGVFGTKSQLEALDPLHSVSALLLRGSQCRIYTLARAARQPRIEYPLWTPAMEQAWCKWADDRAEKTLFQSLLSVAEPETWPVSGVESNWWLRRKEKEGYYQLGTAPLGLCEKIPDSDDLYAVLLYTRAKGKINWMVANRIIGCRIDDRHIVSTLALLVAVKALRPTGSWQEHHETGKDIDNVIDGLEKRRIKKGFTEWRDFYINDVDAEFNCSGTWIQQDEIKDLIHKIESEEKRGKNIVSSSRASSEETLDELLERHRQHQIEEQLRSYIDGEDS